MNSSKTQSLASGNMNSKLTHSNVARPLQSRRNAAGLCMNDLELTVHNSSNISPENRMRLLPRKERRRRVGIKSSMSLVSFNLGLSQS